MEYTKEKLSFYRKVSNECLGEMAFRAAMTEDDFATNLTTVLVEAFIYADQIQEKIIPYYFPKPSFLDWLLRRQKKVEIVFQAKDILLSPPKTEFTKRGYFIGGIK